MSKTKRAKPPKVVDLPRKAKGPPALPPRELRELTQESHARLVRNLIVASDAIRKHYRDQEAEALKPVHAELREVGVIVLKELDQPPLGEHDEVGADLQGAEGLPRLIVQRAPVAQGEKNDEKPAEPAK